MLSIEFAVLSAIASISLQRSAGKFSSVLAGGDRHHLSPALDVLSVKP